MRGRARQSDGGRALRAARRPSSICPPALPHRRALGLARVERQITIKAGAMADETLVLDAGDVRMSSVLAGSDKPLDRQLIYKVYGMSTDQGASAQSIATSAKPAPTMYLKKRQISDREPIWLAQCAPDPRDRCGGGRCARPVFEHKASEVKLKLAIAPGTPRRAG